MLLPAEGFHVRLGHAYLNNMIKHANILYYMLVIGIGIFGIIILSGVYNLIGNSKKLNFSFVKNRNKYLIHYYINIINDRFILYIYIKNCYSRFNFIGFAVLLFRIYINHIVAVKLLNLSKAWPPFLDIYLETYKNVTVLF